MLSLLIKKVSGLTGYVASKLFVHKIELILEGHKIVWSAISKETLILLAHLAKEDYGVIKLCLY